MTDRTDVEVSCLVTKSFMLSSFFFLSDVREKKQKTYANQCSKKMIHFQKTVVKAVSEIWSCCQGNVLHQR